MDNTRNTSKGNPSIVQKPMDNTLLNGGGGLNTLQYEDENISTGRIRIGRFTLEGSGFGNGEWGDECICSDQIPKF